MKRVIDVKSLVIGVLATVLFFTMIGAKSKNANFNTITAKEIKIVNSEGKTVAKLRSYKGEGILDILNRKGKAVAYLGSLNREGFLGIFNKEGKVVAGLGSDKGGGTLEIYNKHGNEVATVQANKEGDGTIYLLDRYGDLGWTMTGKK